MTLFIPSKISRRVLLRRIKSVMHVKLTQLSYVKLKAVWDQVFAPQNTTEQCIELNIPLFINFIDFKAFDRVHHE